MAELSSQLSSFQGNLETFAREHKQEIRKDPEFRRHFQEMCSSIGVDPLASGKGFWSNMLDIGDFYYELGVQIVEVCMASAHKTGGLMELGELRQKLVRARFSLYKNCSSLFVKSCIQGPRKPPSRDYRG